MTASRVEIDMYIQENKRSIVWIRFSRANERNLQNENADSAFTSGERKLSSSCRKAPRSANSVDDVYGRGASSSTAPGHSDHHHHHQHRSRVGGEAPLTHPRARVFPFLSVNKSSDDWFNQVKCQRLPWSAREVALTLTRDHISIQLTIWRLCSDIDDHERWLPRRQREKVQPDKRWMPVPISSPATSWQVASVRGSVIGPEAYFQSEQWTASIKSVSVVSI